MYAPSAEVLQRRWRMLLTETNQSTQSDLFKEGRGATLTKARPALRASDTHRGEGLVRGDPTTVPTPVRVRYGALGSGFCRRPADRSALPRPVGRPAARGSHCRRAAPQDDPLAVIGVDDRRNGVRANPGFAQRERSDWPNNRFTDSGGDRGHPREVWSATRACGWRDGCAQSASAEGCSSDPSWETLVTSM